MNLLFGASIFIIFSLHVKSQILQKRFEDRTYMFFSRTATFSGMEKLCKQQNATIAPARTLAENNFLYNMRRQAGFGRFRMWIGGVRNGTGGAFVWSDGSPLTFTNWIGGEPNNAGGKENCMVMVVEKSGKKAGWRDISCEEFFHQVICVT
ncbi:hypothetical protein LOTGIDRAFT_236911, partial [Lottia gigantea]